MDSATKVLFTHYTDRLLEEHKVCLAAKDPATLQSSYRNAERISETLKESYKRIENIFSQVYSYIDTLPAEKRADVHLSFFDNLFKRMQ